MKLINEKMRWNKLGKEDPYWVVLSDNNKKGSRWDKEEFYKTGVVEIENLLQKLKEKNIRVSFGKALDFGCGLGRLSQAMSRHFQNVNGIDISPSMIKQAEENNQFPGKCIYAVNDDDNLSCFAENSFDFVYSSITLQHVPIKTTKKYIIDFLRVLKPGGILVFQLPGEPTDLHTQQSKIKYFIKRNLPISLLDIIMKYRYKDWPGWHMFGLSKKEVLECLTRQQGIVLDVESDTGNSKYWENHVYVVSK